MPPDTIVEVLNSSTVKIRLKSYTINGNSSSRRSWYNFNFMGLIILKHDNFTWSSLLFLLLWLFFNILFFFWRGGILKISGLQKVARAKMSDEVVGNPTFKAHFDSSQFIVPFLVFFYLGKVLFQVFLWLEGNFIHHKNDYLHGDWAWGLR